MDVFAEFLYGLLAFSLWMLLESFLARQSNKPPGGFVMAPRHNDYWLSALGNLGGACAPVNQSRLIARKGLFMPPEIAFLASSKGGAVVVAVSFLLLGVTLLWALRRHNSDRIAALLGGTGTAVLVTAVTLLAMLVGWWQGAFFEIPLIVILAIELPLQIASYTLWLGWYRWLRGKTARAPLIYGIIVLLFFPIVILVDPIQMERGQFFMGSGYIILADALLGQVVMWSPMVFYELARRRFVYDQKAFAGQ